MVRESGWNTVKLKDICDFIGGGTPSKQVENFWCGNIPWISSSDLIESSIWKINITRHITAEAVAKSATHICPRNTVLVVSRVGVGKVAIAPFEVCTSQDFTNLVSKKHDARFLAYCIQNKMKIMAEKTQGTSIKGVTVENIAQMEIELPPQEEQTAIAEALSDIDNLISSMQKLIQKKKAIKQGSMQELLTGQKRLPGFYGEWEHVKLKDIILDFIVPMRDKPKDLSGEIPWCRIEDFNGKYLSKSKSGQGVTFDTVNRMNLKIFPKETLIVSCSAYLGRCAIVKTELITNQTFIGLVAKSNVSVEFLFYVMCKEEKNLNLLSSGTTISYLSREQFEEYLIYIPKDLAEQQSIAQVLSDMDSEIEQLEKKLSKYQQIKQGMMQELLTGRIRLV